MSSLAPPVRRHFGIYGVHLDGDRALVIRKSRGPYRGMLDLAGGTPEPDEAREQTLLRELLEETGGRVVSAGPWQRFDLRVGRSSTGRSIDFRHSGLWCEVSLVGVELDLPPHEDVAERVWLPLPGWRSRTDLSPPLRAVLAAL